MASRTNWFIDDKFSARVNLKDGFAVADCKEARAMRVLEFLIPLLYPEKPTRITITVGNTIFGALPRERPVDWDQVVKDVVQWLFSRMGKSEATSICPYVFHLYHVHEVLLPAEKKEYRIKEALLKHNVESEGEEDLDDSEESEDSDESDLESLSFREIREIKKQEFARMKKSPRNKRVSSAAKESIVKRKTPTSLEGPVWSYQVIAHNLKEIREREHVREDLIRALCKRLRNVQLEGLLEAVDNLPTQKKIDELKAKNAFLLEKANKLSAELKEVKEDHQKALDKFNVALAFNQKLEAYVGHIGNVVNKASLLFDANLAKNPISARKVIPVLVDFAEKMEELLDEMRVLFDRLQPDVPLVAVENLPDILGEIPSLTGWGKEAVPTETPTKPDQPGPSESIREEEVPTRPEYTFPPRRHIAEPTIAPKEVPVNTIMEEVVRELEGERSQADSEEGTPQPARIDMT